MSITAVVNAVMRAYHAAHDHPKIFDDRLAAALFTPEERAELAAHQVTALTYFDPDAAALGLDPEAALARSMRVQSTPAILARARYVEDLLDAELAGGDLQYVLLGAGLDTFAWRRPELAGRLHIFELDQRAVQADKQRRVARAGWPIPDHLHFVPIDFTTDDLVAVLCGAGFDPGLRSFFCWMGVTYYLDRATLFGTLAALARLAAPGSVVAFDYLDTDTFDDARASVSARRMREIVARIGEPMKTGLDPDTLGAELRAVGLSLVEQLGPADLEARYFADRDDGYHARPNFHLVAAAVPS